MKPKKLLGGILALGLAAGLTVGATCLYRKPVWLYQKIAQTLKLDVRIEDVPADFIDNYRSIKDTDGKNLFPKWDIPRCWVMGMPFEYAKTLASVKNKQGKTAYTSFKIRWCYEHNDPADYAKDLGEFIIKNDIDCFCSDFNFGVIRAWDRKLSVDFVETLASFKDKEDNLAFTMEQMIFLKKKPIPFKRLNYLTNIRDEKGNMVDIKDFFMLGILNLTKEEILGFKDTEKPNALVIYPTNDWNNVFVEKGNVRLFEKIKEHYDIKVVVAEKEQEIYEAIDTIPNIELLVLGGHGSKTSLSLGEEDLRLAGAKKAEDYTIDTSDNELAKYLKKLNPNAVIFLNSCSNAKGKENAENLANFIIENSTGQQNIIAATEPLYPSHIKLKSIYPFDIKLRKPNYYLFGILKKNYTYSHTKYSLEKSRKEKSAKKAKH